MDTIHRKLIFIFLGLSYIVNSQVQKQSSLIQNLLPINSEEKFEKTVAYFNKLQNKKNSNYIFWEKSSIEVFLQAQNWAREQGTKEDFLQAQFMCLMYYDNYLQNKEAIEIAQKLITSPDFLDTENALYTYQALYDSYDRLGFYRQQLEILDKLIALNKKYNYPVRPKTYQNYYDLGKIYYNLDQFELARENFKKQSEIFKDSKDFIRTSSMYNNIALTYKKQNQNDSALHYFNKAVVNLDQQTKKDSFYTKDYIKHFKNVIKSNIANLQVKNGIYEGAEEAYKNELNSSKNVKEPRTSRDAYYKLAELYFFKNNIEEAKKYTDSTLQFEKKFPSAQTQVDVLLLQAKINIKESDIEKALKNINHVFEMNDSLMNIKTEKVYSEATAKYNYVEAQNKLEQNLEILQQKEKTNDILIVFSISALVAMGIILFLFHKAKKSNILINHQKLELAKGLTEKQLLLDEMHHRTKNNLQIVGGILELQSKKDIHPEANQLLQESQQYLESISIIHKMLYEKGNFEDVNLQIYLNSLAEHIIGNYPRKQIQLQIQCNDVELPVNLITSLGLIVAELLTNSLKHAFAKSGSICIKHFCLDGKHQFEYTDDGFGFDETNFSKNKGTGVSLIESLSEDLEGECVFKNHNGFYFQLKFIS